MIWLRRTFFDVRPDERRWSAVCGHVRLSVTSSA